MNRPCIILVQTQLPENIGAAARAMMNFGLDEMRLVAPRDGWPNQRAYDLAGHAGPVLDKATVFATLAEAVADRKRIYAATARSREMVKPVFTPHEAMSQIKTVAEEAVAFLFGPERTGLSNDDVAIADAIITIPTASELTSLNVGQSVVVLAYEWYQRFSTPSPLTGEGRGEGEATSLAFTIGTPLPNPLPQGERGLKNPTTGPKASPISDKRPPADKRELQGFLDRLERELDAVDFWKVDEKKPKMWLNLRNIFTRNNLTEQEVRTLHGVIAELKRGSGQP